MSWTFATGEVIDLVTLGSTVHFEFAKAARRQAGLKRNGMSVTCWSVLPRTRREGWRRGRERGTGEQTIGLMDGRMGGRKVGSDKGRCRISRTRGCQRFVAFVQWLGIGPCWISSSSELIPCIRTSCCCFRLPFVIYQIAIGHEIRLGPFCRLQVW